jgi:hypothetical protein
MKYWLPGSEKHKAKRFLPHFEPELQLSINAGWPCIMVNHSVKWLLLVIHNVLTVFGR